MTVELNQERVNWVKGKDNSYIYYRKKDDRNCGYVKAIYDSPEWVAVAFGNNLGNYRSQVAAQRAVEQVVDPEGGSTTEGN